MHPCTKFDSIWRTSDFGNKLTQKNINDKNFEKINSKIVITEHRARNPCVKVRSI